MTRRIWIGTLDAGAARQGQAQAWRDGTLVPHLARAGAQEIRGYAAFNGSDLAVVAQLPEGKAVAQVPEAAGMPLRAGTAELTYEHVQPGVPDPSGAPLLYTVRFTVPDDWVDEFDRWYDTEHLPMIYPCKHWAVSRRYRFDRPGPEGRTHLALHYLSDARGFDAPELKAARVTPWRDKLVAQRWFSEVEKRIYFRQDVGR